MQTFLSYSFQNYDSSYPLWFQEMMYLISNPEMAYLKNNICKYKSEWRDVIKTVPAHTHTHKNPAKMGMFTYAANLNKIVEKSIWDQDVTW